MRSVVEVQVGPRNNYQAKPPKPISDLRQLLAPVGRSGDNRSMEIDPQQREKAVERLATLVATPTGLGKDEWELLAAAHLARGGLRRNHAAMLARVRDGGMGPGWEKHVGNDQRVCVGRLLKAGLIHQTDEGLVLAEQVEFSLQAPTNDDRAHPPG
jgi:hypothetical protein